MSSSTGKRKTLAQLRAERQQREVDQLEGWEIAADVERMFSQSPGVTAPDDRYDFLKDLLVQAQRACTLLQGDPEGGYYRFSLVVKGKILINLG